MSINSCITLILNLFPEKDTEDKIKAEEKRRQELLNHTEEKDFLTQTLDIQWLTIRNHKC